MKHTNYIMAKYGADEEEAKHISNAFETLAIIPPKDLNIDEYAVKVLNFKEIGVNACEAGELLNNILLNQ